MITTPCGEFTYEELKEIEAKVKQDFKDYWNDKIDVFELEKRKKEMLDNHKITIGQLLSLQYTAAQEDYQEHKKTIDRQGH